MLMANRVVSTAVDFPNTLKPTKPKSSQVKPNFQTASARMAPEGIGRSGRCCWSNWASKASFKYIPPTYKKVAPAQSSATRPDSPPPPNVQPARQLDQTVGKFDARPRT